MEKEATLQTLELTPNYCTGPGVTTYLIKVWRPKYLGSFLTNKQYPLLDVVDRCCWSLSNPNTGILQATVLWELPLSLARQR